MYDSLLPAYMGLSDCCVQTRVGAGHYRLNCRISLMNQPLTFRRMHALGDRNYYRPPLRKDASKPQQQGGLLTAGACQPLLFHLVESAQPGDAGSLGANVAMIVCAWRVDATRGAGW
jgi:hypothetical protein